MSIRLTTIYKEKDSYYHVFENGVVLKRHYPYPFARPGHNNVVFKVFRNFYLFPNELVCIIAASLSFIWIAKKFILSGNPLVLFAGFAMIIMLIHLLTSLLSTIVLVFNGVKTEVEVIEREPYVDNGADFKDKVKFQTDSGEAFEITDLVRDAFKVGEKVRIIVDRTGSGLAIPNRAFVLIELIAILLLFLSCIHAIETNEEINWNAYDGVSGS